jgi:hypothetical protein
MIEIVLYTRPGCHLCEDAQELLAQLARIYPHTLREVDITSDRDLHARYHLTIPVVAAAGQELEAPLTAAHLERFLQETVARAGKG